MDETHVSQQGKKRARHCVERTCIGCRAQRGIHDLLRFACTPEGELVLDPSGRAPGRGVYVCCDVQCLHKALVPARLALALKQPVIVPDFGVVYQAVRELFYKRLRACLGLGQKAGAVVSGYALLQKACAQARVLYMILAEDIAPGRAGEYYAWCTRHNVPCVMLFTKEELGHIIGKSSRSALGLTAPHLLELLGAILTSLERFSIAY